MKQILIHSRLLTADHLLIVYYGLGYCVLFFLFSFFSSCATPTILDSDKTDDKHQACVLEAVILDRMIIAMRKVTIKQQIILIKHAFYHCVCR